MVVMINQSCKWQIVSFKFNSVIGIVDRFSQYIIYFSYPLCSVPHTVYTFLWNTVLKYFWNRLLRCASAADLYVASVKLFRCRLQASLIILIKLTVAFMSLLMATESSVLSLIRSSPIVVFVTSKCNATSCSFCRKAIEELTNTGYDHAVIVATVEEHAVSQFFHLNVLKDSRCCTQLLTVRCCR